LLSFTKLIVLSAIAAAAQGQDRHDWQSLARLNSGDRVRMHLKTGALSGTFQNWTAQGVTVGTVTAKREDVLKIERYRHGGSRAKHIGVGALIGFGGGFAIGASVSGCGGGLGPCFTRPEGGAVVGGAGAVIGALVGAILPVHSKELIYSSGPLGSRTSNHGTGRNQRVSLAALP
jgi:hypothetical protein